MEQREVTDKDNVVWTCVQAYSTLSGKAAEKAAELAESENGQVTVVCTPTGGAQTVRLQLNKNWIEQVSDEDLLKAIDEERR